MSLKGDIIKSAKAMATTKVNSASGKGQPPKRLNSEMSPYASMEEITVISHQLESLTDDVKNIRENVKSVPKKSEMETLIKETVTSIMTEMNENMELTINLKVEEKTKVISQKMTSLQSENESLRKELLNIKTELT